MNKKKLKNPNDTAFFLKNQHLPSMTKDEENFVMFCYRKSAQEPCALEILTRYLDGGVNINVQAHYGMTALHLICLTNSKLSAINQVRLLLERGADPNMRNSKGATPLHILIWLNQTETLVPLAALLIQHGADVNARQENNENALHKLLRVNKTPDLLRAVRLLVESGIRINENGGHVKGFGSALHILCEVNQTPLLFEVSQFLVESGILVNLKDDKNNSVLHLLCRYNQTEHLLPVVRFFVESGTDINAKNDQEQTALQVLCQYNQSDHLFNVAEYLIQQGTQSKKMNNSTSALSLVCKYNQTDQLPSVMKLIIQFENTVRVEYDGCQAIHLCAQYQKENLIESLKILANNGAKLAATNSDGETILHLICQYADQLNLISIMTSIDKSLIQKLINKTDNIGRTPLHYVARIGCVKTMEFLGDYASIQVFDTFGKSYVDYLKDFLTKKGTSICVCCRGNRRLDLIDIDLLYKQLILKPTLQANLLQCSISRIEESIPMHVDHVYVFNNIDKYIKIPSGHNLIDLVDAWDNFDKDFDFTKVVEVAAIGTECSRSCVNRNCIKCDLVMSVNDYIRALMEQVEKVDARFATRRLIFYGSSAEQTKLFQLDEFDFLVVLSQFNEDGNSGRVIYSGDGQATFLGHGDSQHGISSGRAIYYFCQLLRAATKIMANNFNIHVRDITFGETCTTLHLIYCGCGEIIPISIDITIGIARSLFRSEKEFPTWCRISPSSQFQGPEPTEYLVPFRDKCGPPEWRVSYPTLEKDTVLRNGDEVRVCYRILKLLVLLCQHWKSANTQQLIPQKTKPSTYTIKTCLFHYMEFKSPPWKKEDTIINCIGVLDVLTTHPGIYFKSFFNQDLNVAYIDHETLSVCSEICDRLRSCLINVE